MPHGPNQPIIKRAAAALSRRQSLASLGGVVLAAAVPGMSLVEAKKPGKKGKKRDRRRSQGRPQCPQCPQCPEEVPPVDQCVPREAPCRDFAEQVCAQLYPPGQPTLLCAVAATLCCRDLGVCEGEDIFDCLARQLPDD
jgi:hypothetical protein